MLNVLRRRTISPYTVAGDSGTIGKKENIAEDHLSKFLWRCQKNCEDWEFTSTRIAEMLAVSRWTGHRRVAEYGLQDMRGFDDLPDERLDQIIQDYVNSHSIFSNSP